MHVEVVGGELHFRAPRGDVLLRCVAVLEASWSEVARLSAVLHPTRPVVGLFDGWRVCEYDPVQDRLRGFGATRQTPVRFGWLGYNASARLELYVLSGWRDGQAVYTVTPVAPPGPDFTVVGEHTLPEGAVRVVGAARHREPRAPTREPVGRFSRLLRVARRRLAASV